MYYGNAVRRRAMEKMQYHSLPKGEGCTHYLYTGVMYQRLCLDTLRGAVGYVCNDELWLRGAVEDCAADCDDLTLVEWPVEHPA